MDYQKLVLHHFPASRSARVRWMLLETVGDNFELKPINLYGGEQFAPDFLAMNPNHNVPLLEIHWSEEDVQVMLESGAIVEWLADSFPDKGLAPSIDAIRDRSVYLKWMYFGASWMDMMLWQIRMHRHILGEADADPRTVMRYEEKFRSEVEPQLADQLESNDYMLGDEFSAVDVIIGHNVFWGRGYRLCQDDVFGQYLDRLLERPALKQALDDLQDFALAPA